MAAESGTGRFFGVVLAFCWLDAALSAPGAETASIAKALPPAASAANTKHLKNSLPKNSLRMIGLSECTIIHHRRVERLLWNPQAALLQPREASVTVVPLFDPEQSGMKPGALPMSNRSGRLSSALGIARQQSYRLAVALCEASNGGVF
jgi:hypothetical protein